MYRYTTHSATSPMPWLFDEQEIYQISERTLPNFVLYKRRTTAEEHGVNNLLDLNHGGGPLMSRMCDVSEIYVYNNRTLQLASNWGGAFYSWKISDAITIRKYHVGKTMLASGSTPLCTEVGRYPSMFRGVKTFLLYLALSLLSSSLTAFFLRCRFFDFFPRSFSAFFGFCFNMKTDGVNTFDVLKKTAGY